MTAVVPLQHMTSAVIIRTLLDNNDQHSPEYKARADNLIAKLRTNLYTAVSTDLLDLYVDSFPRQLPAFLLPVLAPPHLRTLKLKGCCVLEGDSQLEYKHLKEMLVKCSKLRSLILDECNLTSPLLLADVITQHASQLTSISVEECHWVSDEFIQKLLRGLPNLSYLNISVCPEVTDRVFALTDTQGLLEERDASASGCNLSSVDLSGNQQLTSTCIRHLTELCGPKLRNVSVAATRMDCTILWFLSGYSLSTAVQLAAEANKAIMNGDLASGETLSQLISEFRVLQDKLKSLQEEECQKQCEERREDGRVVESETNGRMQDTEGLKVEMDDGENVTVGNTPAKSHDHEGCDCLPDTCKTLEVDKERELQTREKIHKKIENQAESIKESQTDEVEWTPEKPRTDGYCVSNVDEILQPKTEQQTRGKQHKKVVEQAESMESREQRMQEANRIDVFRRSDAKRKQESTIQNLEAFGSIQDKYNVGKESDGQRWKGRDLHRQDSGRNHVEKVELGMDINFFQRADDVEMSDCDERRTENESWSEDRHGTDLTIVYDDHDATDEIKDEPVEDDSKHICDSGDGFAKNSKDGLDAQLKLFVNDVIEDSCKRLIQDVTSGISRQLLRSTQIQAQDIDTLHETSSTLQSLEDSVLIKTGTEAKKRCLACQELKETTGESRQGHFCHQDDFKESCPRNRAGNGLSVSKVANTVPEACASSVPDTTHLHKTEHSECCSCGHYLTRRRPQEACFGTSSATNNDKDPKTMQTIASGAGSDGSFYHPKPVETSTTCSLCKLHVSSEDMTNEHQCNDLLQAISSSEGSDVNLNSEYSCGAGSDGSLHHPEPVETSTTSSLFKLSSEDMANENQCNDLLQAIPASEGSDANRDSEFLCGVLHSSTNQSKDTNTLSDAFESSKADPANGSDCKEALIPSTANEMPSNQMHAVCPWRRLYTPCILSLDITIIDFDATLVMTCLQEFFRANTHLKKLNVCWKELTDSLLEIIATGAELQSLCLIDCSSLTSLGVANLLSRCRNLQHLDLQGVCYISDAALLPLFMQGNSCNMQSLKLSETNITDATLTRIAEVLGKKITALEISWCDEISDRGLGKIAQLCTSLQPLAFRQCSVSADTLMSLAWNCNGLTNLNMSGVENLTDGVVEAMMPSLRLLVKLDVSWNSDLTNTAVCYIMSCCPLLVELYLMGLKRITERPLMPMISELGKWQRCKRLIQLKMKERTLLKELGEEQFSSDEEYEDLFCPVRSTCYAPCLRTLELQYCDHVNDDLLAELVAICMGRLSITDYYGMKIIPKLFRSKGAYAVPD